MKSKNQDQLFGHLMKSDKVGEPEKAIEDRLMYSFLLKSSSTKVKQNSFVNFVGWVFSAQSIGVKTALVSMVLFFSVFTNQLNFEPGKSASSDSLFIQRVLVADTAHLILPLDSIRNDSLN
jgi:hypothetical protein